jgi:hypothetical protein
MWVPKSRTARRFKARIGSNPTCESGPSMLVPERDQFGGPHPADQRVFLLGYNVRPLLSMLAFKGQQPHRPIGQHRRRHNSTFARILPTQPASAVSNREDRDAVAVVSPAAHHGGTARFGSAVKEVLGTGRAGHDRL